MEMGNSMTADEIRKLGLQAEKDLRLVPPSGWQILFLAEIAAQLAEMNQTLLPVIAAGNHMAMLIEAGDDMADHYADLVRSMFARTASETEIPPSIKNWRKLCGKGL
jgi:hypothetical protein